MRPLCKSNAPKYRLSNNWLIRIFTTVVKLTVLGGIAPPRIAPLLNGIRLELDCENDWLWVTKTWLTWRRRRLNMADYDLAKYDWRRRHCNDDSGRIHHYLERVIPPRCLRIIWLCVSYYYYYYFYYYAQLAAHEYIIHSVPKTSTFFKWLCHKLTDFNDFGV